MNILRPRCVAAALVAAVVLLPALSVLRAQPPAKKARAAAADPEGAPPSRALPDSVKVVRDLV